MSDYVFKYTNTPSSSFVVKPYTVNGPMTPTVTTPYVNAVSGVHAIAINTPLVLVGKGITDYGQVVQNNLLYLAENFCSPTPPIPPMVGMVWYKSDNSSPPAGSTYPAAKGLYVWNGTEWLAITINGELQVNLDANNHRVINVADAVLDTDALTTNSANLRYLKLSGGSLTGNLVLAPTHTVKVSTAPIASEDVTNKLYVDAADLILRNKIEDVADNLTAEVTSINGQIATLYPKTGGQISGNVTITGNLTLSATSNLTLTSGSGVVDFADRVLQNIGDPILAHDAAHKAYVDTTIATEIANLVIPPASQADGVVSAATLDETTGVLTLTRTQGLPAIVATGKFASKTHPHTSADIAYDPTYNQEHSELYRANPPIVNVNDAIAFIDRRLSEHSALPIRTVITQTVAGTTTFTLPSSAEYVVWYDMVSVYLNGIKQYCDIRADVSVSIADAGIYTLVDVAPGSYTIGLVIDSVPYTINLTTTAQTTYNTLLESIDNEITGNSIPVVCVVEQGVGELTITFVVSSGGSGHSITMTSNPTDIFTLIPTAGTPVLELEQTLAYEEVGKPTSGSTTIEFHTAPPVGAKIEMTVYRAFT